MPVKPVPTFAEYVPQFMTAMEASKRAPGTLHNYRSLLRKWLLPAFGDMKLTAITSEDVHDLMDTMAIQTGEVARAHAYNLIQVMMKMAAGERWTYLPSWNVKVKGAVGDHSNTPPEFSVTQARLVIANMPHWMQDPLKVALGSGLRIGELCGLAKGDWNAEDRRLTISRQFSLGKLTQTKTRYVGSVYPIMDAPGLLDYWTQNPSPWQHEADAMFRGPRGARLHPVAVRKAWDEARRFAKVPTMRLHDLRHISLTSYARIPNVTLADIAAFGRHQSIQSAMRYQHSQDADRLRNLSAFTWEAKPVDDGDDNMMAVAS